MRASYGDRAFTANRSKRGTGTARERRPGVWEVRIVVGFGPARGRSIQRSFTVHADAELAGRDARPAPAPAQAPPQPGRGAPPPGRRKLPAMRRAGRFADAWMPCMVSPESFARSLAEAWDFARRAGRPGTSPAGALFIWGCVDPDPCGPGARRWSRSAGSTPRTSIRWPTATCCTVTRTWWQPGSRNTTRPDQPR